MKNERLSGINRHSLSRLTQSDVSKAKTPRSFMHGGHLSQEKSAMISKQFACVEGTKLQNQNF